MNEDAISRHFRRLRDWTYDHYHWAYVAGTAILCQSLLFPSKTNAAIAWLGCVAAGAVLEPCVNPFRQVYGRSHWRGPEHEPWVALTYDDGPDEHTPALLDLLRAEGVKATFFCIGEQVEKRPDVVRRIAAEGHLLANHTYNHPNLMRLTPHATREQLTRTEDLIRGLVPDYSPRFWRPPFGYRAPWTFAVARKLGLEPVMWSINPRDFQNPGAETIVQRTMQDMQPGVIVLLHDGVGPRPQTVEATRDLIREVRERKYEFVRLDQMFPRA